MVPVAQVLAEQRQHLKVEVVHVSLNRTPKLFGNERFIFAGSIRSTSL